MGCIRIT